MLMLNPLNESWTWITSWSFDLKLCGGVHTSIIIQKPVDTTAASQGLTWKQFWGRSRDFLKLNNFSLQSKMCQTLGLMLTCDINLNVVNIWFVLLFNGSMFFVPLRHHKLSNVNSRNETFMSPVFVLHEALGADVLFIFILRSSPSSTCRMAINIISKITIGSMGYINN